MSCSYTRDRADFLRGLICGILLGFLGAGGLCALLTIE